VARECGPLRAKKRGSPIDFRIIVLSCPAVPPAPNAALGLPQCRQLQPLHGACQGVTLANGMLDFKSGLGLVIQGIVRCMWR